MPTDFGLEMEAWYGGPVLLLHLWWTDPARFPRCPSALSGPIFLLLARPVSPAVSIRSLVV